MSRMPSSMPSHWAASSNSSISSRIGIMVWMSNSWRNPSVIAKPFGFEPRARFANHYHIGCFPRCFASADHLKLSGRPPNPHRPVGRLSARKDHHLKDKGASWSSGGISTQGHSYVYAVFGILFWAAILGGFFLRMSCVNGLVAGPIVLESPDMGQFSEMEPLLRT